MPNRQVNTVITALDFSKASLVGMSLGAELARRFHAPLVLMHVDSYVPRHRYAVPIQWMVEEVRCRLKRRLNRAKAKATQAGIVAEAVLLDGTAVPDTQILEAVRKLNNPVLILGTHSRTGIERFFLGSTAGCLLRNSDCPVVTVSPKVMPYWHRKIEHVMLATDLTERSMAPLSFLETMWTAEMRLTVLYVSSPDEKLVGQSWEEAIRQRLQASIGQAAMEEEVVFEHVADADPARAIRKAARDHAVDLLAIGVHPGKAFTTYQRPRTAYQIVMSAPCACVSVRE